MTIPPFSPEDLKAGPRLALLGEPDPDTLAQCLVAMANSDGGQIVLGVDSGQATHRGVDPAWADECLRVAQTRTSPHIQVSWQEEEVPGGTLIILQVSPTDQLHSLLDGRILVRAGSVNRIVLGPELHSMLRSQTTSGEDALVPSASAADLDFDQLDAFRRQWRRTSLAPRDEALNRFLGVLGVQEPQQVPTMAGLLLFGSGPQFHIPQARITFVNFKALPGQEENRDGHRYTRREEITGTAPQQIARAWELVRNEMDMHSVVTGLEREDRTEYPLSVVREVLVNAVAHRDYSLTGRAIEIRMYDGYLEVSSPGSLPAHITVDNMLDEHFSRNPNLVTGLYHLGLIEELGLGIDLIYNVLAQHGHLPPEFDANEHRVRVRLRKSKNPPRVPSHWDHSMNQRQMAALKYVADEGAITNRELRALCPGVSAETLRLDLNDLVERGILLRIGAKRGTRYLLKLSSLGK